MKLKKLSPPPELNNDKLQETSREDLETLTKRDVQLFLEKKSSRKNHNLFRITNKITWEALKNSDSKLSVIEVESDFEDLKSRLILLKIKGEFFSRLIHTRTSGSQKDGFTGKIFISDLKGELIKGYKLENGKFLVKFEPGTSSTRTEECHWADPECIQELDPVFLTGNPQPVEENEYFFLDSGGGDNSEYDWDEAFNEPTWDFDENFAGSGNGNLEGAEEEDKINIDELNNPCVEGIIEELLKKDMTLTGDLTHISQYILDLFNNSSDNSLYFESSQLGKNSEGNDINATTTPYLDGWKINLDTDLLSDGTKLSIGKTIIHESVHAWIRLILKEDRTSDIVKDLNLIYQKFQNQNNRLNLTHHEFMGQYVNVFAISLSVFDNHRQPMDYYISLSWGGLETSTAYSQLPNKNEIQKIIADERFNKVDAKGTPCP